MAWNMVARYIGTNGVQVTGQQISPTKSHLYWRDATKLYKFSCALETISAVTIGQYTSHGVGPYTPNGAICAHNSNIYCTHILDCSTVLAMRKILQVFQIAADGSISLVADSFEPYGMDQIYVYNFCYDDPPGKPAGWEEDYKASYIHDARLISYGGGLHVIIADAFEPQEYTASCWPIADKLYYNSFAHNTFIISSYNNGAGWEVAYELDPGDVDIAEPPNIAVGGTHHEIQALLWAVQTGANPAYVMYYRNGGWHIHQSGVAYTGIENVEAGFKGHWWRANGADLEYSTTANPVTWNVYKTYDTDPTPPQHPFATTYQNKAIIVDKQGISIKVYYDKALDGTIDVPGTPDEDLNAYIGCISFLADYVTVTYNDLDEAGVEVLEVWKRVPSYKLGGIPIGLAIDPFDNKLYATGVTPSGRTPFLIAPEITTIASGVLTASGCIASGIDYFSGGSGWMYPHAPANDFCYLYGYMGPSVKAVIYSGYPGNAAITLAGVPAASYIGALRTYGIWSDDIHFALVYSGAVPSGTFGTSDDAGTSYSIIKNTPFPVFSMLRTYLDEPGYLGSGATTFVGASGGGYACPLQATIDLAEWDTRCGNLPITCTITDIEEQAAI